jgi:hypothetical protein
VTATRTKLGDAFTAKNYPVHRAPARIELLGDKTKRPEPAQHIIEFPGGAIELSRTSEGDYWAHVIINACGPVLDDASLREQARGEVIASRLDDGGWLREITADLASIRQIAVLVRARRAS